jgi:pyruvate carboxylase subunit B
VEKKKDAPAKGENLRTFNVFVDKEYFEVACDEVGSPPKYAQQIQLSLRPPACPAAAPAARTGSGTGGGTCATGRSRRAPGSGTAAPAPAAVGRHTDDRPHARHDRQATKKMWATRSAKGETVLILEAMKMENALAAPAAAPSKRSTTLQGDSVAKGDVLCVIG